MNKRVINEIEGKIPVQKFLLAVLLLLFCLTLFFSTSYAIKYYIYESKDNKTLINLSKIEGSIINDKPLDISISKDNFIDNEALVYERVSAIELKAKEDNSKIKINLIYDINKNDFKQNIYATNKSNVVVRFSYSYDKKEWTYLKNVIKTDTTTITPIIDNTYDIAGYTGTLKVLTNYEINLNKQDSTKIYLRSETIFKKNNNLKGTNKFESQFTVTYNK